MGGEGYNNAKGNKGKGNNNKGKGNKGKDKGKGNKGTRPPPTTTRLFPPFTELLLEKYDGLTLKASHLGQFQQQLFHGNPVQSDDDGLPEDHKEATRKQIEKADGKVWRAQFGSCVISSTTAKTTTRLERNLNTAAENARTTFVHVDFVDSASDEQDVVKRARASFKEVARCISKELYPAGDAPPPERTAYLRVKTMKRVNGHPVCTEYDVTCASLEDLRATAEFTPEPGSTDSSVGNFVFLPPGGSASDNIRCQILARSAPVRTSAVFRFDPRSPERYPTVRVWVGDEEEEAVFYRYNEVERQAVGGGTDFYVRIARAREWGTEDIAEWRRTDFVNVELGYDVRPRLQPGEKAALWDSFVGKARDLNDEVLSRCKRNSARKRSQLLPCPLDRDNSACMWAKCTLPHTLTGCFSEMSGSQAASLGKAVPVCGGEACSYRHWRAEVEADLAFLGYTCGVPTFALPTSAPPSIVSAVRGAVSIFFRRLREELRTEREGSASSGNGVADMLEQFRAFAGLVKDLGSDYSRQETDLKRQQVETAFRCSRWLAAGLPIFSLFGKISSWVNDTSSEKSLILTAPTGSGKSTQVCQYLGDIAAKTGKYVICTQPRSVASLALAERVAKEFEVRYNTEGAPGGAVGYRAAAKTCICWRRVAVIFTTEHALLRQIARGEFNSDGRVFAVIVDEAHERTTACDLLIAMLKEKTLSSALRLVVSSATLQTEVFGRYLHPALTITSERRPHPVPVLYQNQVDLSHPVDYVKKAAKSVMSLLRSPVGICRPEDVAGAFNRHVLCFLPTADDVDEAQHLLQDMCGMSGRKTKAANEAAPDALLGLEAVVESDGKTLTVLTLSGRQTPEEQKDVFVQDSGVKVIFATAVAETAVTIEGVGFVVDTGLQRTHVYDSKRGTSRLTILPISRSSAEQRRGRAGRVGAGTCIRLYSEAEFDELAQGNTCAILSTPLNQTVLRLVDLGVPEVKSFDWIEPPEEVAVEVALEELVRHGAVVQHKGMAITDFGRFALELDTVSLESSKFLFTTSHDKSQLNLACALVAMVVHAPMLFRGSQDLKESVARARAKLAGRLESIKWGDPITLLRLAVAFEDPASSTLLSGQSVNDEPASPPRAGVAPQNVNFDQSSDVDEDLEGLLHGNSFDLIDMVNDEEDTETDAHSPVTCAATTELPDILLFASQTAYPGFILISMPTPVSLEDFDSNPGFQNQISSALSKQVHAEVIQVPTIIIQQGRRRELETYVNTQLKSKQATDPASPSTAASPPNLARVQYVHDGVLLTCAKQIVASAKEAIDSFHDDATRLCAQAVREVALQGGCRVVLASGGQFREVLVNPTDVISFKLTPSHHPGASAEGDSSGKEQVALAIASAQRFVNTALGFDSTAERSDVYSLSARHSWQHACYFIATFTSSAHASTFGEWAAGSEQTAGWTACRLCETAPLAAVKRLEVRNTVCISVALGSEDPEATGNTQFDIEAVRNLQKCLTALFPTEAQLLRQNYSQTLQKIEMLVEAPDEQVAGKIVKRLRELHNVEGNSRFVTSLRRSLVVHVPRSLHVEAARRIIETNFNRSETRDVLCQKAEIDRTFIVTGGDSCPTTTFTTITEQIVNSFVYHQLDIGELDADRKRALCIGLDAASFAGAVAKLCHDRFDSGRVVIDAEMSTVGVIADEDQKVHAQKVLNKEVQKHKALAVARLVLLSKKRPAVRQWIESHRSLYTVLSYENDVLISAGTAARIKQLKSNKNLGQYAAVVDGVVVRREPHARPLREGEVCSICFDDFDAETIRLSCLHRFCTECLQGMFASGIQQVPIKCPAPDCGEVLSIQEIALIAPETIPQIAELAAVKVRQDRSDLAACPHKMCNGIVKASDGDRWTCWGCQSKYCN
eukprot:gene11959-18456_t